MSLPLLRLNQPEVDVTAQDLLCICSSNRIAFRRSSMFFLLLNFGYLSSFGDCVFFFLYHSELKDTEIAKINTHNIFFFFEYCVIIIYPIVHTYFNNTIFLRDKFYL